ncbi:WD40/YVTN/BNR-like repeat-containing protein [candidate division CSSED10-310 bacterium]|uniref:WD40/YVTN/BNR-like repeat-containing protein n=1 Tax=candidate division CSSED10-310 bacterium TaxID=2855610 RepID=A0ABV6Z5B7_UNCC1
MKTMHLVERVLLMGLIFMLFSSVTGAENYCQKGLFENSYVKEIKVFSDTCDILMAGYHEGIFVGIVADDIWEHRNSGLNKLSVNCVLINPDNNDQIFVGTCWSGIYVSNDRGFTWEASSAGLKHLDVVALECDPETPGTLFAGTLGGGVYRSTDSGKSWSNCSNGLKEFDIGAILVAPWYSKFIYAASFQGSLYFSGNGVENWQFLSSFSEVGHFATAIKASKNDPYSIYVATYGDGVKFSSDGGRHWRNCNNGMDDYFVWDLEIHPSDPNLIFAGTKNEGVFVSIDGGMEWHPFFKKYSPNTAFEVILDRRRPQRFYVSDFCGNFLITEDPNWECDR